MIHGNHTANAGALDVFTDLAAMMTQAVDAAIAGGLDLAETGFATLTRWSGRAAQRRHLAELDEHLLRDIGMDRDTARTEARKPFWVR